VRFQPFLYAHLAVGVFILGGTCIVCGRSRNQRQLVVGVEIRDDGVDGRQWPPRRCYCSKRERAPRQEEPKVVGRYHLSHCLVVHIVLRNSMYFLNRAIESESHTPHKRFQDVKRVKMHHNISASQQLLMAFSS
jgi:hypothetical protein